MSRIKFVQITNGQTVATVAETSVRVWAKKGWRRVDEAPAEPPNQGSSQGTFSLQGPRHDSPQTLEADGHADGHEPSSEE